MAPISTCRWRTPPHRQVQKLLSPVRDYVPDQSALPSISRQNYSKKTRSPLDENTLLSVDGCFVKAPSGVDNTGPNSTGRAKSGQKRSALTEDHGLPSGVILAGSNRHDSPLLPPTLECLSRFGSFLPETIRVDLDSGYDSQTTCELLNEFGCDSKISPKGKYIAINHTRRWNVERVNSWHTRGFGLLQVVLDRINRVQQV